MEMPKIHWIDSKRFRIGQIMFRTIDGGYKENFTTESEVIIIKPRRMLDWYERFFVSTKPINILEFGIFQGGSELLILSAIKDARLLAFDLEAPVEPLQRIVRREGWDDRAELRFEVSQDNVEAIQTAIAEHFGAEDLDLVIDDASHLYAQSRRSFEIAFPRIRPGGTYIIEDWGWANWSGAWQHSDGQWHDQVALTNLIFELTMVAASRPDLVAGIEIVSKDIAVIRRGGWISDGKPLALDDCYQARGRRLQKI